MKSPPSSLNIPWRNDYQFYLGHYLTKLGILYNTYMNKSKVKSQKIKIVKFPQVDFGKKSPKTFMPRPFRVTQHKGG